VELAAVLMFLVVINVAAWMSGRDSRDGNDWAKHPRP